MPKSPDTLNREMMTRAIIEAMTGKPASAAGDPGTLRLQPGFTLNVPVLAGLILDRLERPIEPILAEAVGEVGRCSFCGYDDRAVMTDDYGWRADRACCDICRALPREALVGSGLGAALSGVARVIIEEIRRQSSTVPGVIP